MSTQAVLALLKQGKPLEARALLLQHPLTGAEQDFLLGACAHMQQQMPEAVQYFTAALKQDPKHARAASALATLYAGFGRADQAVLLLRNTLKRIEDSQLRFNLGVALETTGDIQSALDAYTKVLTRDPLHYASRHNRAGLYAKQMRLHDAAADYEFLTREHPDALLPWQNLADIRVSLGQYADAISLLTTVLARDSANSKALLSLAIAQAASAQFNESRVTFRKLKIIDPSLWESVRAQVDGTLTQKSESIDPRLIYLVRQHEHLEACQWQDWDAAQAVWHDVIAHPAEGDLLPLSYRSMMVATSADEQLQLAKLIDRQQRGSKKANTLTLTPTPRRLRVGYMSYNFRRHATGLIMRHFFTAHDKAAVELVLITLDESDNSDVRDDILASADQVIALHHINDADAAKILRDAQLDILVDINGYTTGARAALLCERLAPVQLHWLIMAGTTGSPTMDYYISDPHVSPGNNWCTETEVFLPETYFIFSPPAKGLAPTPSRASLGLPEQAFVFCCLNAPHKIDPDTFALWMRLLKARPNTVLWLYGTEASVIMNLKREAEWAGVDPRRLYFAGRIDQQLHMARMAAADLFLDTRYYNAHTTATEALYAGLPLLTCPGEIYPSRVGKSIVLSVGLPELVARDWDDYEQIALRAVDDREWLAGLRQRLAQNRETAAVFDMKKQARDLEKAYRHMRERFAQGLAPQGFSIADLPDSA